MPAMSDMNCCIGFGTDAASIWKFIEFDELLRRGCKCG
jgi:hypothetical protein